MPKTPFTVVSGDAAPGAAPAGLGPAGTAFWRRVQAEYGISDIGGLALLEEICAAKDRVESLREAINADGPVVRNKRGGGVRGHPALQSELQNRAFIARSLERLGISVEPVKSPGHPTSPTGWKGER
jgi:hypothetical protein